MYSLPVRFTTNSALETSTAPLGEYAKEASDWLNDVLWVTWNKSAKNFDLWVIWGKQGKRSRKENEKFWKQIQETAADVLGLFAHCVVYSHISSVASLSRVVSSKRGARVQDVSPKGGIRPNE